MRKSLLVASILFLSSYPVYAQEFAPGQRVEFKPNRFQDVWEEGIVVRMEPQSTPNLKQVLIKSVNPSPYNPNYYDQAAYEVEFVRPKGVAPSGDVRSAAGQSSGRPNYSQAPQAIPNTSSPSNTNSYAPGFKVGDAISVMSSGTWYPAKILDIQPSGGQNFGIKVEYQPPGPYGSQMTAWTGPGLIRHRAGNADRAHQTADQQSQPGNAAGGPRLGRYLIYTYGAPPNRIFLGYLDLLAGGRYKASNPGPSGFIGQGLYSFDGHTVHWLSGPYKDQGWGGEFTIEREGKTHKIRMRSGTVATNSTDS